MMAADERTTEREETTMTHQDRGLRALVALWVLALPVVLTAQVAGQSKVAFTKTVLDSVFRSEGVAVGDLNKDGKRDIATGTVWYEQPVAGGKWQMHLAGEKAPEYDPLNYSH